MQYKNSQTVELSQEDQKALVLGRKLYDAFHSEKVIEMLDKALYFVMTNPNLGDHPYLHLIDNLFVMKWIFSSLSKDVEENN